MASKIRIAESPFLSDWLVISLRWLVLLGMTTVLLVSQHFNPQALAALVISAVWNIFVSLLAILNRRLPAHRLMNLAIDWSITLVIFYVTDGMTGPVMWAGMLILLPAAIYYGLRGSLIASLLFAIVQIHWTITFLLNTGNVTYFELPVRILLVFSGILLLANLFVGLVIGLLANGIIRSLRRTYQDQVNAMTEGERKAQQAEHERMRSFYHLLETLSATLNYQVVLETALDLSATALGENGSMANQMLGVVLLFDEGNLRIGTARHLAASDLRQTFPAERGVLFEIVQSGETCLIEDPAKDPELVRLVSIQSCRTALALPLRRGLSAFGMMLFAHPDVGFFSNDRIEALEAISHQAVIAIQNARLFQDVENEKERILESDDEARKKLARDLHDGPAQSLSSIAMGINIARKFLEIDVSKAAEELVRVEDMARRTTQEIRHMLFTLRPLVLESEGLSAALRTMADKMHDTYQQNVLVEADPSVEQLMEVGKQTVCFYLAEEAVNNARKHAQAAKILVRLNFLPKDHAVALLEVIDNGVGFDVNSVHSSYDHRGSLGMVNLRERTELINGILNIDSVQGRGTCVSVLIPLSDEAADRLQRGLIGANNMAG